MHSTFIRQIFYWFFFLSVSSGFATDFHDYFYSITEMKYNKEKNQLEMSIKLAAHDLDYIFKKEKYCDHTEIAFDKENAELDECLADYLCQNFNLTIKNKKQLLEYVGKEYENDGYIFVYFVVPDLPRKMDEVHLKNTIFFETYDHQKNITHFEYFNKENTKDVQTYYFSASKTNHTFNIKL